MPRIAAGLATRSPHRVRADKAYTSRENVATRPDKLAVRYEAAVLVAAVSEWL
ncbi:hypothetical protein J2X68_001182 [Streptomyces sp. 3330]|uniref:hypothetical protein n=1 Tax=Streptomyces sp. 3330 TaxID=2817755 RepID=UPI00285CD14D|nr:hypothetical protein [Streptomyces sp. 3330]MDR6974504.1 hypothetical protein [Streptomyces sp. 3330]